MNKRVKNIKGRKFNKWKVLDYHGVKKYKKSSIALWKCKCDCGNIKIVSGSSLISNSSKSCGCFQKKTFGESSTSMLYKSYEDNAKKRDLKFDLTIDQFSVIIKSNCYYCNSEPKAYFKARKDSNGEVIYNGVDRLANLKGYTIENSKPCCKLCNFMKRDLTVNEFRLHIQRVYKFFSDKG